MRTLSLGAINISNDVGACGAVVHYDLPTAVDNCALTSDISVDIPSGSFFSTGLTKVTFMITDAHGMQQLVLLMSW